MPQRPGAGLAPSQDGDAGLYATMADGRESPFWHLPAAPGADTAAEPPKPLHEMSADELRAFAAGELARHGQANGFGSPSWGDDHA